MITPYNQVLQEFPSSTRTRITLWLLDQNDFYTGARELEEIPDTLLLFLRKLRRLTIDIPMLESRVTYERDEDTTARLTTLKKHGAEAESKRFYYMQKQTLTDLPAHHSRPEQHKADLILTFPLDESFKPVIEPQNGFNFLIQSDLLITQPNRQGVHLCPGNYAIREEICYLFVKAVKYFCTQDALAYEWLHYLPRLRDMIFEELKQMRILLSFGGSALERPMDVHSLSSYHCNRRGKPLLNDLQPAVYLSYFLDRLVPYLQGKRPRYMDAALDDDWHTRIADFLVRTLRDNRKGSRIHERIVAMPLIPAGGGLTAAKQTGLYFPNDDQGNLIPKDLKKIVHVDWQALESPLREELCKLLGAILTGYDQHGGVTLDYSVSHLRYLFHTLDKDEAFDKRIFIMNKNEIPVYRAYPTFRAPTTKDDLYFETLGDHGTEDLAQLVADGPTTRGIPKPEMHLIHSAYVKAVPAETLSHGRTWEQWLQRAASVRRLPRLKHHRSGKLSDLAMYIGRYWPMGLIIILKKGWERYAAELTPNVIALLEILPVPCQNQSEYPLKRTYYPSKEMQRFVANAGLEADFPIFLDIPDKLVTDDASGWKFLCNIGVTLQPTIGFFFDIIQSAFFRVYKELLIRFADKQDELRRHFENAKSPIYIPQAGQRSSLLRLETCYWEGHPCLVNSLAQYRQYTNDPHVAHLFKNVLRVPDADLFAYLSTIESLKIAHQRMIPKTSINNMGILYRLIARNITCRDCNAVWQRFNRSSLVYSPAESRWPTPEDCLWTETPQIDAQFGISKVYPELEDFFRNHLKVSTPTAATYIGQLRTFVSERAVNIVEIKSTLHKMSSVELSPRNQEDLLDLRIFPVVMPGGCVKVSKPTSAFRGRVPFLDFSLTETRQLHPLLEFLVEERTVVEDPADGPSSAETRAFRSKSRHVYRGVLHYNTANPESSSAYDPERLKKATVHLSGGFTTVQSDSGLVHISGSNDLRIYIPGNPMRYCGLREREASLMFQLIYLTPEYFVEDLLDGNGIIRSSPDVLKSQDDRTQHLSIGRDSSEFGETDAFDDGTYTPRSSCGSIEGPEERQSATTELHCLPLDLSRLKTIGHELGFGVRSDGQIEHDIKIGAAGELFVFELLLRLSLPGFTCANWRSTIHIVYDDTDPVFTRTLVNIGLLRGSNWLDATPTYYIEVKTTTGGWSDAFS
ncbi:hypothetical protein BDW72DRAFT_214996 [Aspergillus terricola var. indicus]